jgi:hypothetical protein
MLARLEIDNFRCFEGFVYEPARKQLISEADGCVLLMEASNAAVPSHCIPSLYAAFPEAHWLEQ